MMVRMSVSHMSLTDAGFVLVFRTPDGKRALPVGIGLPEAQMFLLPDSSAHDLAKRFLDMLECRVERVELCGIRNGTAACRIVVRVPSGAFAAVDAKAGDAVALALRTRAPVFADAVMLEEAGTEADAAPPPSEEERLAETRHRLHDAVAREQYEEAARLRDELRRLTRHTRGAA